MALVSCDWQITRMVVVSFTAGLPGANQDKVQGTEIRNLEISLSATCSSAAAGKGEHQSPQSSNLVCPTLLAAAWPLPHSPHQCIGN